MKKENLNIPNSIHEDSNLIEIEKLNRTKEYETICTY